MRMRGIFLLYFSSFLLLDFLMKQHYSSPHFLWRQRKRGTKETAAQDNFLRKLPKAYLVLNSHINNIINQRLISDFSPIMHLKGAVTTAQRLLDFRVQIYLPLFLQMAGNLCFEIYTSSNLARDFFLLWVLFFFLYSRNKKRKKKSTNPKPKPQQL